MIEPWGSSRGCHWFKPNGEGRCGDVLQNDQGRADLAAHLGNPSAGRDGARRLFSNQWRTRARSNTSPAFITRAAVTQPSAGKAPWLSNPRWPKRAVGAHQYATGP